MEIIENKYYKIYQRLVNQDSDGDNMERHHIVPRSLGGTDEIDNLVWLTTREHYIAHLLLTKFTVGQERSKMVYACNMMCQTRDGLKVNSRLYEYIRKEHSLIVSKQMSGKNNPNFGNPKNYKHSDDIKAKISKANKGRVVSNETKAKISKFQKSREHLPLTENHKLAISEGLNRYIELNPVHFNKGKKHSDKSRKQMSESRTGEKHFTFKGYYITPFGKFSSVKKATNDLLSATAVRNWCKNSEKTINGNNFRHSKFLRSLEESPIGKTFKELGFDYIEL